MLVIDGELHEGIVRLLPIVHGVVVADLGVSHVGGYMERAVVRGMAVDPANATSASQHNGKTHYFCSKSCKGKVRRQPVAVRDMTCAGRFAFA